MYLLRIVLLIVGVICCSTAALMIRAAAVPPLLVAAYRLLLGTVLLSPAYLLARRRHPGFDPKRILRQVIPAGVLLAVHFWSWNHGVRMTAIANASLIVNLVPVAMPFVVWLMVRERIGRLEVVGTVTAMAGTVLLAVNDYHLSRAEFLGDLLCFGSMVTFAAYLAWNRRAPVPSVWLYVPPVYLVAGLLCLVGGYVRHGSVAVPDPRDIVLLIGLAVVPTALGHTLLNVSMRTLRSQVVAITNLGQFIPAAVLAWVIFDEIPSLLFIPATALVVTGALVAILGHRDRAT